MFYTVRVRLADSTKQLLIGLAILAIAAPAHAMSESKIKEMIVGKTVTFYHNNKEKQIIRYFDADGTLFQTDDEGGFQQGIWTIDDGNLCIALKGGHAKCRKFIRKNGKFGTANKKGKKLVVVIESSTDGNQIKVPENAKGAASSPGIKEQLVTLTTRGSVTETFLLVEPAGKPKGIVLLIPGHKGVVHFKKIGESYVVENEGGGLTAHEKSRDILGKNGFVVAVIAPPSDQKYGMDTAFRRSDKHSTDVNAVIKYLNDRYSQKVNLWGHCLSSVSPPAIVAHNKNQGVAGLILSSTRSAADKGTVFDVKGEPVKVRMLLVQHTEDPCDGTPYKNSPKLLSHFRESSPEVELLSVSGGDGDRGPVTYGCSGGHHAFKGQRGDVVKTVVEWLEHKPIPKNID